LQAVFARERIILNIFANLIVGIGSIRIVKIDRVKQTGKIKT